jgi:hypothetical protein
MAFFKFTLPGAGQFFQTQSVDMDAGFWPVCQDHGAVYKHSLRVLSSLCREPGDLTIAFSGGADSWFLVLCLHQLVARGEVSRDRVQIWSGDYTYEGRSLTPDSGLHDSQFRDLGLSLQRLVLRLEDAGTERLLMDKFYQTASHSAEQVAQFVLMDQFPGRVLVAEGGPVIYPVPRLLGAPQPVGDWAMLNALQYERGNRVLFHSLDPDLWGSWLIGENVEFRPCKIRQEQYQALTVDQQHLWSHLQYHWRYRLYSAGFPSPGEKFLWKKPSWQGLLDPNIEALKQWRGLMHYHLWQRHQHLRQALDPVDWAWWQRFYEKAWVPINLIR